MSCGDDAGRDDLVVLVDEEGGPIGSANRFTIHGAETPLHRGFSVFLFNSRSELLLQRRANTKRTWPGVWSNSVCGHPRPGETSIDAAARRLRFELGLSGIELVLALPDFRYRAERDGIVENEICPVFVGYADVEPMPNPAEVSEVKWIDWVSFLEMLGDPNFDISPWAIEEARELAAKGYPAN